MESALYGIYALVVFVSEILLVRWAHSFDFWYVNNSCLNTVQSTLTVFHKTNSNIALRVFRHFFLPQFVKDAWLWAWVIHAEHIRAMWLAVV